MSTDRKIIAQGNSLAVILPKWMLEQHGLYKGDYVRIDSYPDQFISLTSLVKADPDRARDLKDRKPRGGVEHEDNKQQNKQ